jgi:hypothetical protein
MGTKNKKDEIRIKAQYIKVREYIALIRANMRLTVKSIKNEMKDETINGNEY